MRNPHNYITIREAQEKDIPFLWDMLYEAASISPEMQAIGRNAALELPGIKKYLDQWGRYGDYALVAVDNDTNQNLGAAWYRFFPSNDPGYGYITDSIPEISMAVIAQQRAKGIGSLLLERLIAHARQQNIAALSLSVDKNNPAKKWYETFGFSDAGVSKPQDTSITLILRL